MEILKFEIHQIIKAKVEKVWNELTNNEEIKNWFPELTYHETNDSDYYRWYDGNLDLKLDVIQKEVNQLMVFEWAGNIVQIQLKSTNEQTELSFSETLSEVTKHTPKDLAGWYVCIEKIRYLAEKTGKRVSEELWKIKYQEYRNIFGLNESHK
ncbi:SRPBCC domain-containing protein [Rummeliibacillus pycnus]|uniref:SRPBCC domain-containing protein n=1 Tax=Rummeliibacillus pycnus TaxID=101070 RepID=UPI000C999703|nr:SRPBCC domain-containing protein [Rummeliibacillus pycnus]